MHELNYKCKRVRKQNMGLYGMVELGNAIYSFTLSFRIGVIANSILQSLNKEDKIDIYVLPTALSNYQKLLLSLIHI